MRASRGGALAWVAVLAMGCGGSGPTDPSGLWATLEIDGPATLIVHEMSLLEVTARSRRGATVPLPTDLSFDSSDSTVATVSSRGVVTAHGRGQVTISASAGALRAEVSLSVRARVKITPAHSVRSCYGCDGAIVGYYLGDDLWPMALGDTLHLVAGYADVDGVPLGEEASATWSSSSPAHVSVSQDGDAVAHAWPSPEIDIVAVTPDGADSIRVIAVDTPAGLPATLRLAHAAIGLGPVTFVHNKGEPVTLSFGESVDVSVTTGLFYLDVEGMPPPSPDGYAPRSFATVIREGDRLSIIAEGDGPYAFIGALQDRPVAVPADSVRVRLLQGGTSAGVVYILEPDEPADGLPQLCYFDPPDFWGYTERPLGDLDFVMKAKYGPQYAPVRIRASPRAGRSVTYVITESAEHPIGIIAFEDP